METIIRCSLRSRADNTTPPGESGTTPKEAATRSDTSRAACCTSSREQPSARGPSTRGHTRADLTRQCPPAPVTRTRQFSAPTQAVFRRSAARCRGCRGWRCCVPGLFDRPVRTAVNRAEIVRQSSVIVAGDPGQSISETLEEAVFPDIDVPHARPRLGAGAGVAMTTPVAGPTVHPMRIHPTTARSTPPRPARPRRRCRPRNSPRGGCTRSAGSPGRTGRHRPRSERGHHQVTLLQRRYLGPDVLDDAMVSPRRYRSREVCRSGGLSRR